MWGGEDGDLEDIGLGQDSSSGSDRGDGEGADKEGGRSDDEERRKDSGRRGGMVATIVSSERAASATSVIAR